MLAYARELARVRRSDIVTLQGASEEGLPVTLDMLIGPASELIAVRVETHARVESDAQVAEIERRTRELADPMLPLPAEFDIESSSQADWTV